MPYELLNGYGRRVLCSFHTCKEALYESLCLEIVCGLKIVKYFFCMDACSKASGSVDRATDCCSEVRWFEPGSLLLMNILF